MLLGQIFFITWMIIYFVYADVDPCVQVGNDYIPSLTGRREDCAYSSGMPLQCDITLLNKWYRSENKIATSAPKIGSCGTTYPIWMNGTIPSVSDGIVTRTACVNTINGPCDKSYTIEVKNCTIYYAYHLVPTSACNERYCFAKSASIPCTTTTTTTTSTTTTVMPKPSVDDKKFSEGEAVCIKLPVLIAVVILLVAVFVIVLIFAVCIKRQMWHMIQSRPSTPTPSLKKNSKGFVV